jgi:hypothetical protein
LLLESVKGQVFERNMEVNFEAALASVFPSSLRGYQPPARFTKEVHNILERSERINIPSILLIGVPVSGTDIGELLSGLVLSRAGDLSCSDGECCYLFLNDDNGATFRQEHRRSIPEPPFRHAQT